MKEKGKTHEQLMEELEHLRKRVAEFESVDAKHKQSVETLRESERSYRNLALNIPGIVYRVFLREDNRMEFYNDMLLPMSGFKAAELTKGGVCSIDPLIIDEDHPKVLAAVEKAIKKNLPFNIEYRIRHKNGDRRYFSERGRSIPGPDGKPLIISSVIFDITERKRAEEELQHKEHYFRALIEGSIDGIMVLNRDGKIRYESPGCLSLLGYTPEERIGHSALDPIYPEELQAASSLFRQLISGLPARAELRARHKDGSWHVIECTLNNLLDDTAVEGIVVNLRDITERRKTEEKLRESEKKYSTLVEQARDGVHITQDKVITFANKRMAEMSGYTVEELTGKSTFDLVPPDVTPELEKRFALRAQGAESPGIFHTRMLCKDGTVKEIENSTKLIQYKDRPAVLSISRDITERKQMEDELLRIHKAVESSSDAIGMSDSQGHHFYHNKAFTDLFEYTPEELESVGGGPAAFADKKVAREVFDAIMGGGSWSGEVEMVSKSGRKFTVLERADAIKDEDGKVIGLVGIHTDITERKQWENKLNESKEELRFYLNQITKAQEEERKRIARELHDDTIQELIALSRQLGDLAEKTIRPDEDRRGSRKKIEEAQQRVDTILKGIRRFTQDLRPSVLDDLGLVPALEWLTSDMSNRFGVPIKISMIGTEQHVTPDTALAMFRIAQESLRNAGQHSKASQIQLNLKYTSKK